MNRRAFLGAVSMTFYARSKVPFGMPRANLAHRDGERLVERWSWVMGQPARIRLFTADEEAGFAAAAAAFGELRQVEASLSLYDPASDLVALNERAGQGPLRVGPDLLDALRMAEHYRTATRGAFDPAIEPLMEAWGFHRPRSAAPSRAELQEAREAIAATRICITNGRVALSPRSARLDLGGIGVGYGLDRAGEVLRRHGIRRALIDISGDMLALSRPPGRPGWPVDIPSPGRAGLTRSILLQDAALATSANTVSVVRYGAVTCGHVLEPWSGKAAHALQQVSVIASTAVAADALSTAILVSDRPSTEIHEAIRVH